MKYSTDERIKAIIRVLLGNDFLNIEQVCKNLSISRRNFYYVLEEINQVLNRGYLPSLNSVYGKGIMISIEQKSFLTTYMNQLDSDFVVLTKEQRIAIIYCETYLSKGDLRVRNFESLCAYSKFTIMGDLNELRLKLEAYDLQMISTNEGYRIEGNEFEKRKAFLYFYSYLYELLINQSKIVDSLAISRNEICITYRKLKSLEIKGSISFYECSIMGVACLLNRVIERGNVVDASGFKVEELNELDFKQEKEFLSNEFPQLSEDEFTYFLIYIYCSKIDSNIVPKGNPLELAKTLVDVVYSMTGVDMNDEELLMNLSRHLNLASLRFYLGIVADNPLLHDIKSNYAEYFNIVQHACNALETKFHALLNENEIAFITLYFAGYLCQHKVEHRVRILLICFNGLSTSYLLRKEIESLDASIEVVDCVGLSDFQTYNYQYDFIVSTITLEKMSDVVQVHAILSIDDKATILKRVNSLLMKTDFSYTRIIETIKPYVTSMKIKEAEQDLKKLYGEKVQVPKDTEICKRKFVHLVEGSKDWKEIIQDAGFIMEKEGSIEAAYTNEIISNIEEYGPYMIYQNHFLLGHASVELSNRLGLSFSLLKEPLYIQGERVEKILILSPIDYTAHLSLLNKLFNLFNDEAFNEQLRLCNDEDELYTICLKSIFS